MWNIQQSPSYQARFQMNWDSKILLNCLLRERPIMLFIDWLYFGVCTISKSWYLLTGCILEYAPSERQSHVIYWLYFGICTIWKTKSWYLLTGCILEYAPSESHGIYWLAVFWSMHHIKVMVFIDCLYFGVCTISKSWYLLTGCILEYAPSESHGIYWLAVCWSMHHLKVMVFIDWLYFGVGVHVLLHIKFLWL